MASPALLTLCKANVSALSDCFCRTNCLRPKPYYPPEPQKASIRLRQPAEDRAFSMATLPEHLYEDPTVP